MKSILQAALLLVVLTICTSGAKGYDSAADPEKDNSSVSLKKVKSEVESRQFDGNLGETVNNLTKDYIKGVVNPTPEEVNIVIVSLPSDINLSGVAWPVLPICKRLHLQAAFWDVCNGPRNFSLQSLFHICLAVFWCFNRALKYKVPHICCFLKTCSRPRHFEQNQISLFVSGPSVPLPAFSGSYSSVCKGLVQHPPYLGSCQALSIFASGVLELLRNIKASCTAKKME